MVAEQPYSSTGYMVNRILFEQNSQHIPATIQTIHRSRSCMIKTCKFTKTTTQTNFKNYLPLPQDRGIW